MASRSRMSVLGVVLRWEFCTETSARNLCTYVGSQDDAICHVQVPVPFIGQPRGAVMCIHASGQASCADKAADARPSTLVMPSDACAGATVLIGR